MQLGGGGGGGGGSHFTSGARRCCVFFLFFSLVITLRFRAVIVSVSTPEKPHASTLFFFWGGEVCFYRASVTFGPSEVRGKVAPFFDHGGHRGSRRDSAAPDGFPLGSSEQRVRHLQERHAAHR